MFLKIKNTRFPPKEKPMMVWDGDCGFCKYWVSRWKSKTDDRIDYRTYQQVAHSFRDIPLKEFKKASRLIETNGSVYNGPDSAYRSFTYFDNQNLIFHSWYRKHKWFAYMSDHTYNFIVKHRGFMLTLSKLCFGKNPEAMKPYWFIMFLFVISIIYLLLKFL